MWSRAQFFSLSPRSDTIVLMSVTSNKRINCISNNIINHLFYNFTENIRQTGNSSFEIYLCFFCLKFSTVFYKHYFFFSRFFLFDRYVKRFCARLLCIVTVTVRETFGQIRITFM